MSIEDIAKIIDAVTEEAHELSKCGNPLNPDKRTKAEKLAGIVSNLSGAMRLALDLPTRDEPTRYGRTFAKEPEQDGFPCRLATPAPYSDDAPETSDKVDPADYLDPTA